MAYTNASSIDLAVAQNHAKAPATTRAAVLEELRRLLPGLEDIHSTLPFDLPALDTHLPQGGLACGALHEVVPETDGIVSAAFGFMVAVLARLPRGRTPHPRHAGLWAARTWPAFGHGLNSLGLDPARVIFGRNGAPQRNFVGHGGSFAFGRAACRRRHDRPARSKDQPEAASRRQRFRPAALSACGRRRRWKPAPPQRAGASARRKPRATVSGFSRARAGICSSNAAATDVLANG